MIPLLTNLGPTLFFCFSKKVTSATMETIETVVFAHFLEILQKYVAKIESTPNEFSNV